MVTQTIYMKKWNCSFLIRKNGAYYEMEGFPKSFYNRQEREEFIASALEILNLTKKQVERYPHYVEKAPLWIKDWDEWEVVGNVSEPKKRAGCVAHAKSICENLNKAYPEREYFLGPIVWS